MLFILLNDSNFLVYFLLLLFTSSFQFLRDCLGWKYHPTSWQSNASKILRSFYCSRKVSSYKLPVVIVFIISLRLVAPSFASFSTQYNPQFFFLFSYVKNCFVCLQMERIICFRYVKNSVGSMFPVSKVIVISIYINLWNIYNLWSKIYVFYLI